MLEIIETILERTLKINGVEYFVNIKTESLSNQGGNTATITVRRDTSEEDPDFTVIISRMDIFDLTTLLNEIGRMVRLTSGVYVPAVSTPMVAPGAAPGVYNQ